MKKTATLLCIAFVIIALLAAFGCERSKAPEKPGKSPEVRGDASPSPLPDVKGPSPLPDDEKPSKEGLKRLVDNNNMFAMELYQKLVKKDKNGFFSPYSISTCLAMAYVGARGKTAEEMAKAMNFEMPLNELNPAFATLISHMNKAGEKGIYKLSVANRLFGEKSYEFKTKFLDTLKQYYGASLELMDFANDPNGARKIINTWVEQKTNNKIKNLLPPGSVRSDTRLVLVNAIYFKSDWKYTFDKKKTKKEDFRLKPGETKKVDMMNQKGKFRYTRIGEFEVLELPYKKDELSMLVILPRQIDGIHQLDKNMTLDFYKRINTTLRKEPVILKLPKFKLTVTYNKLGSKLSEMGIKQAFQRGIADFTGMSKLKDLFISKVIHKAFIAVDEEGTEAAAATAIVMATTTSTGSKPPRIIRFYVDRPFVMMIRDNKTGSILFMGRIMDPESKLGK